jgi:hypothetical protein
MATIIVGGSMANKPANGGNVWERLSWVVGLRRLGVDAWFVEQIAPEACVDDQGSAVEFAGSASREFFLRTAEWFGIADRAALICTESRECAGLAWPELVEVANSAGLLLNLSGHLTLAELVDGVRRTAYVDVDPGFTQLWHADTSNAFTVAEHDFYFTIGENIAKADCPIPTGGIDWRLTRQPVVLDDWPVTPADDCGRFTTIASWRGPYGPIEWQGRTLGLKCHEFRKCLELPKRMELTAKTQRTQRDEHAQSKIQNLKSKITAGPAFEIALAIHPADERDRRALVEHGWKLVEPRKVTGDAEAFRCYVQQSGAEFSVAQGVYVDTNSGWFSDRTVRYLASGKPALIQETGFSRHLPCGEGLVAFRTLQEAVDGARRIMSDYDGHCQASRAIAEKYFDSDKVLGRMLEEVGI